MPSTPHAAEAPPRKRPIVIVPPRCGGGVPPLRSASIAASPHALDPERRLPQIARRGWGGLAPQRGRDAMVEILLLVIKVAVVTLIFAIGLGSSTADLMYLWRRPGQLVRSLLAMYVAVPLALSLLAKGLALPAPVRLAIFVLAISAGAPLLPRKLSNLGRAEYVFSLVVTSSLVAVVAVPAWMELLGPLVGRESGLHPRTVAALIAKALLVPLALGMVLHRLRSKFAGKLSE